ncbi:hypothetical protein MBLNU230_g4010t1 [Neophaeotheca triangularis]
MKKPGRACFQCRTGKRKCDRPVGEVCQPCVKRKLDCSSAIVPRRNAQLKPAASPTDTTVTGSTLVNGNGNGGADGPGLVRMRTGSQSVVDDGTAATAGLNGWHGGLKRGNGSVSSPGDSMDPRQKLRSDVVVGDGLVGDVSEHLTIELVRELIEYYLSYIHDKPHAVIHAPTLRRDVENGIITKPLLYSILALSARFHESPHVKSLGPRLAEEAKTILQNSLETFTLANVQAWIVLANNCGANAKSSAEALYFGIATRMAHILGLPNCRPEDNAVESELKIRIWWSLYMIDRWSAAGLGLPRQMHDRDNTMTLSMDEYDFHNMAIDQPILHIPRKLGLWAHMVTLVEVFGPIQDLNRELAFQDVDDLYIASTVSKYSIRLEDWQHRLPADAQLNIDTLAYHKSRGHGRTLVALHLGYYHYATLLYFQYLDATARASCEHGEIYALRCREHASAYSDLLRTSYEFGECEAMYNIVGHMTVVSSSVLIHTLLFGSDSELGLAKARLESNFKILMRLKSWWPSVEQMIGRLIMFQNACLRSADNTHTHKVDRWMVKYLLEHAILLGDKSEMELMDTPSPTSLAGGSLGLLSERGRFTSSALSGLRNDARRSVGGPGS